MRFPAPGLACIAVALLVGSVALAQPQKRLTPVGIDPETLIAPALPSWVTPTGDPPAPAKDPHAPLRLLVLDQQVRVATGEHFFRSILRVESEAGLQSAGQVSVSFDPTYQQLRWHVLRVWRDGKPRDLLQRDTLQVVRQEEDAEHYVYHGRVTALALLRDVRVGDSVEYAVTRTGENPVFAGLFSTTFVGAARMPIDRLSCRILCPAARTLHVRTAGDFRPAYQTSTRDGVVEHRWTASDVPAVHALDDTPAWAPQFPYAQVTEFESWAQVAEWGRGLFVVPPRPEPEVVERVAELTRSCVTDEQKANAIVRFVQDDIRYVAVTLGESSHRPFAPAEVLQRRFGDCKDKSLLLVTLLRQAGIQADVALVNSDHLGHLAEMQPSPLSFDHAIVRVVLPALPTAAGPKLDPRAKEAAGMPADDALSFASRTLWLDATMTLQGGAINERYRSDFGCALVLERGASELQRMDPLPAGASAIEVNERFQVPDREHPATLEVVRTYRGGLADLYRQYRRTADPQRGDQQLTAFLARMYPKLQLQQSVTWTDDRARNVLTARAAFAVPEIWTKETDGKTRKLEVEPWAVAERLPSPEAVTRTVPFAMRYPLRVVHTIDLGLWKDWPITPRRHVILDEAFRFAYQSTMRPSGIHLRYEFISLRDSVAPADMASWTQNMADVRTLLGYRLRENIRLAAELTRRGVVWPLVGAACAGVIGGLVLALWLYWRRPAPALSEPPALAARPIGGWLMLVAIGVVLRPFTSAKVVYQMTVLARNHPYWVQLTDPDSGAYAPGTAVLLVLEALLGAAFLVWSCVLVPQFFARKASTRVSMIAYLAGVAAWLILDTLWARSVGPTEAAGDAAVRTIAQAVAMIAIWVPYFFVSRRVRETFVR